MRLLRQTPVPSAPAVCLQHERLIHGQYCHHSWSKQATLLTCKAGPEEEEEEDDDDDDTEVDGDDNHDDGDNHDGDDDDADDELTEAPAAIEKRDVSRMVSGMMTNLDVSSKARIDTAVLH